MNLITFIIKLCDERNVEKISDKPTFLYNILMAAGIEFEELGIEADPETCELTKKAKDKVRKWIIRRKIPEYIPNITDNEGTRKYIKNFLSDNLINKESAYKSIFSQRPQQLDDKQIVEVITENFFKIAKNEKCSSPQSHESIDEIEDYLKECEKNSNLEVKFLIQFSLPYIAFYFKEHHQYEIEPSWMKVFLIKKSFELYGITNPYKETDLCHMILNKIKDNYIQPILQNLKILPQEITDGAIYEAISKLKKLNLLKYNENSKLAFSNITYQNYFAAKHIRNCIRAAMATEGFAAEFLFSSTTFMKDALYALPKILWSDDVCEMLGKIQSLPDREEEHTHSCLQDAFNLLRGKKLPASIASIQNNGVPEDERNMFIQNLLNTLRITYQGCITAFDFRDIDFGDVSLDCIKFSKDGKNPCKFHGCQIHANNFNKITNMVFSPDEKYLLVGINGGYYRLINRETGEIVHDYTVHTHFSEKIQTCNLKFSPKGNYFTVSTDILTIWNINKPDSPILSVPNENIPFEFSPDEDKFLYYKDRQFYCLFLKTNKTVTLSFSLSDKLTPISFTFHEDGQQILILFKDTYEKKLYLFELEDDNLQYKPSFTPVKTHNLLDYYFEKQEERITPSYKEISYPSSFETKKHLFSPNHKYCLFISKNDIVLKNSKTDQEIYRFKEDNEEIRKWNDIFENPSLYKVTFSSDEQYILIIKRCFIELYHITDDSVEQLLPYYTMNDKIELIPIQTYFAVAHLQADQCFYVSKELGIYKLRIIDNAFTAEEYPIIPTQDIMKNCVLQTQSEPIQHLLQQFGAIVQSV